MGSNPFNLDPFIFGHFGTMQGGGQRDVEFRGRGRKRTKGCIESFLNLARDLPVSKGGGKSEYAIKRRVVVTESINFSMAAADEDQPRREQ